MSFLFTHSARRLTVLIGTALFLASSAAVYASGGSEVVGTEDLRPVTVVLDWLPNTNHAGIYLALERGYYAEEGLAPEVVQPSEVGSEALVAGGAGEFGISFQEAVTFARTADAPLPIVAIAAVLQHNTSGYAAPADGPIDNPGDFAGTRYGGWATEFELAMLDAVMAPYGTGSDDVETVNVGTLDFIAGFEREMDFTWIFYGWSGIRAELEDYALTYMPLVELDPRLDYYTPVIIASEETLSAEPEMVRAFLRATTRGYRDAIENPGAAADALLAHAPETDRELAIASLVYLAEYFIDPGERWGEMDPAIWQRFTIFLDEQGLLPNPLEPDTAFTNDYLPEGDE